MIRNYNACFTVAVKQIWCLTQFSEPEHVEQKTTISNSNDVLWKF